MNSSEAQTKSAQDIPCTFGACSGLVDEKDYVFLVICTPRFPGSTLRSVLTELRTEFYKNNPTAENDLVETQAMSTRFIYEIGAKYSKPTNISKTAEAQEKLREVTIQIQKNLENAVGGSRQMQV